MDLQKGNSAFDKITSLVDEAVDTVCFDSSKDFSTISYNIFIDKLIKDRLGN